MYVNIMYRKTCSERHCPILRGSIYNVHIFYWGCCNRHSSPTLTPNWLSVESAWAHSSQVWQWIHISLFFQTHNVFGCDRYLDHRLLQELTLYFLFVSFLYTSKDQLSLNLPFQPLHFVFFQYLMTRRYLLFEIYFYRFFSTTLVGKGIIFHF